MVKTIATYIFSFMISIQVTHRSRGIVRLLLYLSVGTELGKRMLKEWVGLWQCVFCKLNGTNSVFRLLRAKRNFWAKPFVATSVGNWYGLIWRARMPQNPGFRLGWITAIPRASACARRLLVVLLAGAQGKMSAYKPWQLFPCDFLIVI